MAFLATSRSRRANAGANMSKLLDQEEAALNEDDFYKTHYGGFEDIANDSDFDHADSSDSENVIDSDFDIDETADQPAPEDEEAVEKALKAEEREAKTKRSVYKDPKARGSAASTASRKRVLTKKRSTPVKKDPTTTTTSSASSSSASTPTHSSFEPPAKKQALSSAAAASTSKSAAAIKSEHSDDGGAGPSVGGFDYRDYSGTVSRSLRKSTQNHSAAIREMLDERQRESTKRKASAKKNATESRPLTQKELLKEAQKTEIENTKWLENYKLIEIERVNRAKAAKTKKDVPVIRYHSYIDTEEVDDEDGEEEAAEEAEAVKEDLGEGTSNGEVLKKKGEKKKKGKKTRSVSRTVITFPSEESFRRHFPALKTKEEKQLETLVVVTPKLSSSAKAQPASKANGASTSAAAAASAEPVKQEQSGSDLKKENGTEGAVDNSTTKSKPFSLLSSVKLPRGGSGPVSCVITGRPARYFDPLTQQPFADVSAFKLLRYYYGVYLREAFPEQRDRPEMVEFLRQHTDSARQMTVSGPRATTIRVNLMQPQQQQPQLTKVVIAGGGPSSSKSSAINQTAIFHHNVTPQQQQQGPTTSTAATGTTTFRVLPQQLLQLQQLAGVGAGRGAGGPPTFTLVPQIAVAGGTTSTATPLNLISSAGGSGSGGGNVFVIQLSGTNHRGNPILRTVQQQGQGQPVGQPAQLVAVQQVQQQQATKK